MTRAAIIFTRLPIAGETKTRLMPALSPDECAVLALAMIGDAVAAAKRSGAEVYAFHTPDAGGAELSALFGGARCSPQSGADLGERMMHAMNGVLALGHERVVLFGTDVPMLDDRVIAAAFDALDRADVVVVPTADGGYCLIGMKSPHDELWRLDGYGGPSVSSQLMRRISDLGLTAVSLPPLRDADTIEDLRMIERDLERDPTAAPMTRAALRSIGGLAAEECDRCGACARGCSFLRNYSIVAADLARRDDLAFSCFLCGACRDACHKGIDGSALARAARRRLGAPRGMSYRLMLWEKMPYRFANYRRAARRSVLFPGCSFPALFPRTSDRLVETLSSHGVGVAYECCGKPAADLGACGADDIAERIEARLRAQGVEELIMVCANCFYFLRGRIDIPMVSVYRKLHELGEGMRTEIGEVFAPCPDRREGVFMRGLEMFADSPVSRAWPSVQCCGLGGAAAIREPEAASEMTAPMRSGGAVLTYCASCAGALARRGIESTHVLTKILGVDESPSRGIAPFLRRAMRKFER